MKSSTPSSAAISPISPKSWATCCLQVLFYAEMAANEGHFTIADVLDHLNRKLIRRHPHVFGDEASRAAGIEADVDAAVEGSSAAVLRNWEEIKAAEKAAAEFGGKETATGPAEGIRPASRLDSVHTRAARAG